MSIKSIKNWFTVAVPGPTPDNQRVQVGVHIEEFCEMLDTLTETSTDSQYRTMISGANQALRILSNELKKNPEFKLEVTDKTGLLDALCDQIVTSTGIAHMYGYDIKGALDEVARSNESKFDIQGKPLFNEHGKIMKGPAYFAPALEKYIT